MTESGSRLPAGQDAVARFAAGARELRQRTEAARTAILTATASGTAADGAVTATVDVNGVLTDLRLTAAAGGQGPDALARDVLAATKAARVQALQRAERDVATIVGVDSPAVAILQRQERELAPQPDAADEGFTGRGAVRDGD